MSGMKHIRTMKGIGRICKAALLMAIGAGVALACESKQNQETDLVIGTYGNHLYHYGFDSDEGSFTLKGKAEALNPSYVLGYDTQDGGMEFFAVSEAGTESGAYSFSCTESDRGTCRAGLETPDNAGTSGTCSCARHSDDIRMTADLRQTGASPCFILIVDNIPFTGYSGDTMNQGKECTKGTPGSNQGKQAGRSTGRQMLMTADYTGGSISIFPINGGRLDSLCCQMKFEGSGPVEKRQQSSHIHQLKELPEITGVQGKYILATDLGADVIRLLKVVSGCNKIHSTGTQTAASGSFCPLVHVKDIPCPAGSGPRHMEFSKDLRTLYCITELSGDVLVYSMSEKQGEPDFEMIQKIQADEVNAGGSADIHLHPSGKYLYTSHRLDNDGIAIFRTNEDGTLEKIGYTRTARHPRNFMITEDGRHLIVACRDDKVIQVFRIGKDGSLTLLPQVLTLENDKPSSITATHR